jgi:PAS domain S-box-containing protein
MLIGISYVAISATLAYLVHRARRDIPFSWMFLAFGLFIVACGGTHFMEVLTVWHPFYWLAGDVKVVTAFASVATALTLPSLVPKVLSLLETSKAATRHRADLEAAHKRLQELEELSRQASLRAAAGTATWELDIAEGKITWAGDFEKVWGRPASELQRRDRLFDAIHPDDTERLHQSFAAAIQGIREYEEEFRIVFPDGTVHWVITRGRVRRDETGKPTTMVGVTIDVTARKKAENALLVSEKLAVAGRMAATIAHEINNPLNAVGNLLYLIRHDSGASERTSHYSDLAEAELKRVAHIVRQTLGFYRESNAPVPTRVTAIIDNALELHLPQLAEKEIAVKRRFETDELVPALAGELRQVFANLIVNAIDALPQGGKIIVHVCGSRDWSSSRKGVRVCIADSGPGIPAELQRQIFEPFFTTKGNKGTGLGLWVAAGIVAKHMGNIRLRSSRRERCHGTIFSIFLPS